MTVVSAAILDQLTAEAAASPRRRLNLNLHASPAEPCQRFFNAMEPDSYLRPHRHLEIPKSKLLVGIRGSFARFLFDDAGAVVDVVRFAGGDRAENAAVEVPAGQWNTVIALETGSILLEVKGGPFKPTAAGDIAAWSPAEGSPEVEAFLASLRSQVR
ncbi:hypothetical protein CO641_12080 [Lysobacteraceae bacterium NML91-0213]|nr:hypothetical protein CO641_12080 [Xanthomonadaceae bacterium NML91-0213]